METWLGVAVEFPASWPSCRSAHTTLFTSQALELKWKSGGSLVVYTADQFAAAEHVKTIPETFHCCFVDYKKLLETFFICYMCFLMISNI